MRQHRRKTGTVTGYTAYRLAAMRTATVVGGRVIYVDQGRRRRPLEHFAAKALRRRLRVEQFAAKAPQEFLCLTGGDPFFPERRRWQAPKAGFFDAACLKPRSRDRGQVCLLV